jgi:membrane protease YdiL (CAAX protease family)
VALCLVAGLFFFSSLDRLWPLPELNLVTPRARLRQQAEQFLGSRGFDLSGFRSSSRLVVDTRALDYVDRAFGRERTQDWIADGAPLFRYRVYFKKIGDPTGYVVEIHPAIGVLGWSQQLEEDGAGERIDSGVAQALVGEALSSGLGLDPARLERRSSSTIELDHRRDHSFRFEQLLSSEPELRERVEVRVAGDRVARVARSWVVPAEARRAARAAEAPGRALETVGFGLLALAVVAAFFIFLKKLRDGTAELESAVVWPAAVFVCLLATYALQDAELFASWEPLWPRWVSNLRYVVFRAIQELWIVVVLLALVAAADALERERGSNRGASLRLLGRGRLLDASVARASIRGFLVGLLCGGVMAAAVTALQWLLGAGTDLQPRGFFFYPLNSRSPAATSLLFFFGVALAEELGYRFFGGSWLLSLTGRRWPAVLVPAVIYGLTHTRLDFLPTADPFWARALILTLVGVVWGWAFFRYDALTVVLSHYTADLFVFNWPQLASGQPGVVFVSGLVVSVPLLPALLWLLVRGRRLSIRGSA